MRQFYAIRFNTLFYSLLLVTVGVLTSSAASAQLNITNAVPYNSANYLINNVFSDGTVTISNVQAYGQPEQYGFFSNGMAAVGIDSGIVLSTWELQSVTNSFSAPGWGTTPPGWTNTTGQNFGFSWMGTSTNNNLLSVSSSVPSALGANFSPASDVNSACAISFDFVPTQDTMKFKFVFASDEWNTFPCSQFNDVFGFFVAGPGITGTYNSPPGFPNASNVAFVPGTSIPITISSITHPTATGSCGQSYNSQYYVTGNTGGSSLNAHTTVIEIEFPVQMCQTYNFTMAIANAGDVGLQSAVYMEANSFGGSTPLTASIEPVYNTIGGDSILYEGCGGAGLTFTRNDTLLNADTIPLNIFGNATMGLDYDSIPDSLYFAQGQDSVSFYFDVFYDNIVEGAETLYIAISDTNIQIGCGGFEGDTMMLIIMDPDPITTDPIGDTVMCTEPSVNLFANVQSGIGPFTYLWNTSDTLDSINVNTPTSTTNYYVTITDACSLFTYVDTVSLVIDNPPTAINTPGDTIDCESPGNLVWVDVTDPMPQLTYQWSNGNTASNFYQVNPLVTTDYYVTVSQTCAGYSLIDTFTLYVDNPPFTVTAYDDTVNCTSDPIDIGADVSYTTPNFSFNWSTGQNDSTIQVLPSSSTQYMVSVTDACGQNTVVDTVNVYFENNPVILNSENFTIDCAYDTAEIGVHVSRGFPPYTYSWSTGENDSSIYVTTTAQSSYQVTVTDICGISQPFEIIDVAVREYPDLQVIPFDDDTVKCPGDFFQFGELNVVGGSSDYDVSWTQWQDKVDALWGEATQTQTYFVEVADNCNLDSTTSSVTIHVPIYDPLLAEVSPDTFACPGDELTINVIPSGGAGEYQYRWNTGESLPLIFVESQSTSNYQITVLDACENTTTENVLVTVEEPVAAFEADFINASNAFFRNHSIGATSYRWDFGDGAESDSVNPSHEYQVPQEYYITLWAYNDYGCYDTTSIEIEPPLRVYIPNSFSPNGDGINETFRIEGEGFRDNSLIKKFTVSIFDRWGTEIFSSNSPDFEWDGSYDSGHDAEVGVYVYKIFIEGYGLQKIEESGTVTIVK